MERQNTNTPIGASKVDNKETVDEKDYRITDPAEIEKFMRSCEPAQAIIVKEIPSEFEFDLACATIEEQVRANESLEEQNKQQETIKVIYAVTKSGDGIRVVLDGREEEASKVGLTPEQEAAIRRLGTQNSAEEKYTENARLAEQEAKTDETSRD